jgi:uncharacterized protein (TIGR02599 family)
MNPSSRSQTGFTLVELMVSTSIIALIMLVLVAMTNQTAQTWRHATEKIEKFQLARDGFESMTRKLSQATLNTSWDYLDGNGKPRDKNVGSSAFNSFVPMYYGRTTDLRIVSGPMNSNSKFAGLENSMRRPGHGIFFQAPFGVVTNIASYSNMDNLLNTWGYFVEAGYDQTTPGFITAGGSVPKRWRTRLMEFMQPSEQMSLYDPITNSYEWFTVGLTSPARPVRVLAENVLTLIILPKLSKADEDYRTSQQNPQAAMLSPYYVYDSTLTLNPGAGGSDTGVINPKNQLPPILTVTMVAIDERSAEKLADKYCQGAIQGSATSSQAAMGLDIAAGKVGVNYGNLFTDAMRLEDDINTSQPGDGDLYDLERILTNEGCTYRVFTSNVSVRGAKWSRIQTK